MAAAMSEMMPPEVPTVGSTGLAAVAAVMAAAVMAVVSPGGVDGCRRQADSHSGDRHGAEDSTKSRRNVHGAYPSRLKSSTMRTATARWVQQATTVGCATSAALTITMCMTGSVRASPRVVPSKQPAGGSNCSRIERSRTGGSGHTDHKLAHRIGAHPGHSLLWRCTTFRNVRRPPF